MNDLKDANDASIGNVGNVGNVGNDGNDGRGASDATTPPPVQGRPPEASDHGTAEPRAHPPALRVEGVVVHVAVTSAAPSVLAAPRDLPDLARTLFHALLPRGTRDLPVLHDVTLDVERGTCVALVGETRCGKSALARACARLVRPRAGTIAVDGVDVHRARGDALRQVRRALQVIPDDVEAALDPLCTVERALALADGALNDGALVDRALADRARIREALGRVGLEPSVLGTPTGRLPLEARKRAALARALLAGPVALVWDEPTDRGRPSAHPTRAPQVLRAAGPPLRAHARGRVAEGAGAPRRRCGGPDTG